MAEARSTPPGQVLLIHSPEQIRGLLLDRLIMTCGYGRYPQELRDGAASRLVPQKQVEYISCCSNDYPIAN